MQETYFLYILQPKCRKCFFYTLEWEIAYPQQQETKFPALFIESFLRNVRNFPILYDKVKEISYTKTVESVNFAMNLSQFLTFYFPIFAIKYRNYVSCKSAGKLPALNR